MRNDFAASPSELDNLTGLSGAQLVASNLTVAGAPPTWGAPFVRDLHGLKVGFFGVSALDKAEGGAPTGVDVKSPTDVAKAQIDVLKKQGATAFVALAAVGRGEAKRIADVVPELTAIVVGSSGGRGEANTETPAAEPLPSAVSDTLAEQLMSELAPRLSEVMEKQVAAELRKNIDQTVSSLLSQLDVNVREIVRDAVAEKLKQPRDPSSR